VVHNFACRGTIEDKIAKKAWLAGIYAMTAEKRC